MRYVFFYNIHETSFDGITTRAHTQIQAQHWKAREMKRVRCNDHDK